MNTLQKTEVMHETLFLLLYYIKVHCTRGKLKFYWFVRTIDCFCIFTIINIIYFLWLT